MASRHVIPSLSRTALGLLSAVTSMLVWQHTGDATVIAAISGTGIVIYEVVEVAVIGPHFLQALYAALGFGIVALAAAAKRGDRPQMPRTMTIVTRDA